VKVAELNRSVASKWQVIVFLATIGICLQVASNTVMAQNTLDQAISLDIKDTPLKDVLDTISRKSGLSFSYSSTVINANQLITIKSENEPVKVILDNLLASSDIQYTVVEEQIVLRPSKSKTDSNVGKELLFTFSGYVKDESTGEGLIGVAVYISELEIGTITNAYGFFSLTIPPGMHQVIVSYVGYQNNLIVINHSKNEQLNFLLKPDPKTLEEIVIYASLQENVYENSQNSLVNLRPKSVMEMPALFGEVDIIKSLQVIPGIKLFSDGSTFFHVRGGDKDQNLILLDEAPIYNPSHLLGFFSTFIPDALKDIKIYKGNYPAQYGGRLSSLIDVRTKDGNMNQFNMNGSLGLISARLSLEGPIVKNKASYYLSGRRSYIKWLLNLNDKNSNDLYFYDINTKVNFHPNRNNRFYFSLYAGEDYFSQSQGSKSSGINWKNTTGTLRWNHIFNDRLFSNTTVYGSNYDYYLLTSIEDNAYWNSHISNFSIKSDFTWFPNPENTIDLGIKIGTHNINPGNYQVGDGIVPQGIPVVSRKNASEITLYAGNQQKISKRLSFNYGLRFTSWSNYGEAFEFSYNEDYSPVDTTYFGKGEDYHTYIGLEPRLSIVLKTGKNNSLKASYCNTKQYINMISNSISPFTSLEVWLPASPNIKPQKGDMVSLGYFQYYREKSIEVSLESWYRWMHEQIDYADHADMLMNPLIESELRFGDGWAYGIDFMVTKKHGKLNGWLGYSWSRAFRQFDDLNEGKKYPAYFDRPHEISLYANYKISKRLDLSGNWLFTSGNTFSSPTSFYSYNGHTVPIYTRKNNDRMPVYHRLDLSILYRLNKKGQGFEHSVGLGLYNLYGHKNPVYLNFNKINLENQGIKIPGNLVVPPPLVPTQLLLYNFVPSITYNFRLR